MNDRLHIAFFTNTYHPVISGVVRSVAAFRQALTGMGHNVFVFAQATSDYVDREPFVFRYPAIELPVANDFPIAFPISNFVDKLVPALKLDVIHSHHPFLIGQGAVRKAEEHSLPLVFTHHTRYREYSHYLGLSQDVIRRAIERLVGDYMQHCQHVIVPSESIKRMLYEAYGMVERVTVLPTGIDPQPYESADGAPIRRKHGWGDDLVIITIGRLAGEKSFDKVIGAAARVMARRNNVRLVLLGDGDERRKLEKLSRELGVEKRVEFTGLVPFEQVPAYLKAADIFCFASTSETQGLVTLEAMAASLPVVAVDATGTSDVVEHEVQGLLTENNSEALAAALERVVADDALRQSLRQAATERARSFAIDRQAERLVDVYRQAIVDKKANRTVHIDRQKPIFRFDWQELLGLGGEQRSRLA